MLTRLKQYSGLTALIGVTLLIMSTATAVDYTWTRALDDLHWPRIEALMERSIFEGEGLGANDPVLLMLLGAIWVYYVACRKPGIKKWARWRPQAAFAIVSALATGIYFVHSLKWIMGRARPDLVIRKGMGFSHWFEFGPHFVTDGVYYGSFPSGHTSQMFILMSLAFILAGSSQLPKPARICGWFWGVMAVAVSLIMGLTRCMTLSHWLTDILGSILFGWIIMHLIYYHLLRVPDQLRFIARHGTLPELPEAWEIKLCLFGLIGVAGLMMLTMGIRALIMGKGLWLFLLAPSGMLPIWLAWNKSAKLLRSIWRVVECSPRDDLPLGKTQPAAKEH